MIYHFLFIGYGSIAKQHINNLILLSKLQSFVLKIDLIRRSTSSSIDENQRSFIQSIYTNQNQLNLKYTAIFITNPTSEHYITLKKSLEYSDYFFIEKPIFQHLEYDLTIVDEPSKHIYIACPLRFKKLYSHLKLNLRREDVLSFHSISSSYLPSWRPNEDYRQSYSAHANLGGGADLDLIHEWDYIHDLFGEAQVIKSFKDKISSLDIHSHDLALYLVKYTSFYGEIHLDYFGKYPQRKLQIILKNDCLDVDFITNTIEFKSTNQLLQFPEANYQMKFEEMKYFLMLLTNFQANINSPHFALKTLGYVLGRTK